MGRNDVFMSFSGTLIGFVKGQFEESALDNATFLFSCSKEYFYGPEEKIIGIMEFAKDERETAKKFFLVLRAKVAASEKKGRVGFSQDWAAALQNLFHPNVLQQMIHKKEIMEQLGFNVHKR